MAVQLRLSGGELNTLSIGSLGGIMSNTAITTAVSGNLFDDITRAEALQGRTEYRMFWVMNPDASTVTGVTLEISTNPALSFVSIGLDPAGKSDGKTYAIPQTITAEDQAPTGIGFFGEDTASSDGPYDTVILPIGILRQNEAVPVWMKRTTEKGVAQVIDVIVTITHDAVTLPGDDVDDGSAIGELMSATTTQSGNFLIDVAKIGFANIGSP